MELRALYLTELNNLVDGFYGSQHGNCIDNMRLYFFRTESMRTQNRTWTELTILKFFKSVIDHIINENLLVTVPSLQVFQKRVIWLKLHNAT